MAEQHPLWDLPTRVFHWSLPILLPLAWWTAEEGNYDAHEWIGYTLLVLVLFRIVWGFIGSRHSRFRDFLAGPRAIVAYLKGQGSESPGHNALGGWSVMALLGLLLIQALSGLVNTDDVFFSGPLHYWVPDELRDSLGAWHDDYGFYVLLGFIALHIAAVLFYQFARRQLLVQAMWRGRADGRTGNSASVPLWRALLVVLVVAGLLWGLVSFAPQPQPMW